MTQILFDLTPTQHLDTSSFDGGGEYTKEVLRAVLRKNQIQRIACAYLRNRPLDSKLTSKCAENNCELLGIDAISDIATLIADRSFDRFYSALARREYAQLDFGQAEFVLTVHGLRGLEMPVDRCERHYCRGIRSHVRHWLKRLLAKQDVQRKLKYYSAICARPNNLIVVSSHTKHAILSILPGIIATNITVLYSPRKKTRDIDLGILQEHQLENSDYILLIAANKWMKNAYRAVQAIDALYSRGVPIPPRTLLLGAPDRHQFDFVHNKSNFIIDGYVSEGELEAAYKHACMFIYPTLNEGFGYPPLEAMKYGTPVLASAISSVPEVCGNAALYFNPFSVVEIQTRVLQMSLDNALYACHRKLGVKRAAYIAQQQDEMLDKLTDIILA